MANLPLIAALSGCTDYTIEADKADPAPFDTSSDYEVPEDSGSTDSGDGRDTGRDTDVETGQPDTCSWDDWVPEGGCDGAWPGTGRDGVASLDGTFAPMTTSLTADASGTTLAVGDGSGFAADDEVFVLASGGGWAFGRVVSASASEVVLADAVSAPSGAIVQRVPHYRAVTVGTVVGRRVVFRACGPVTVEGRLSADGGGWPGGQRAVGVPETGWQGQSEVGSGTQSDAANGTGGGGGAWSCNVHADGGGGGYATAGTKGGDWDSYDCGGPGGQGGGTLGDQALGALHFGGGGGSGYLDDDASPGSYGGGGGAGGGVLYVVSRDGFGGPGTVGSDGARGEDGAYFGSASPGGGGGGAGGSVRLVGDVAVSVSAVGGAGGIGSEAGGSPTNAGTGGEGRIRVDGRLSGTATPPAYEACP